MIITFGLLVIVQTMITYTTKRSLEENTSLAKLDYSRGRVA